MTPMMQMFDEDKSGHIDEDEFFFLLQYLGIEVSTHNSTPGFVAPIRSCHLKNIYKYIFSFQIQKRGIVVLVRTV